MLGAVPTAICHAAVDLVLAHRRAVDDAGDRHVLRAVGIGPGAHPGDEQRAVSHARPPAAGQPPAHRATAARPHDPRSDQQHDATDHQQEHERISNTTPMVGLHAMSTVADDVGLALQMADEADALTLDRFGALDLHVETKPDLTPVTDADESAEELLRGLLADTSARRRGARRRVRRHSGFRGSAVGARSDRRHQELRPRRTRLVDAHRPAGRRRTRRSAWSARPRWAGGGGQARARARSRRSAASPGASRCRASPTLDSASLSFSDLTTGWDERRARFVELTDAVWRVRGYGDFWSYCLLAEGAVDIVAEPEVKLWDLAPLDILVREAGGRFTNIDGAPGPARRQRDRHQRTPARRGARPARDGEPPRAQMLGKPPIHRRPKSLASSA